MRQLQRLLRADGWLRERVQGTRSHKFIGDAIMAAWGEIEADQSRFARQRCAVMPSAPRC